MNYDSSCVSTQSAGVIILYDNLYECIETYTENGGRIAIAVVKGEIEKLIVALMLVLVECYDNKIVKATPHLFHPFVDSALGSQPTTKKDVFFD